MDLSVKVLDPDNVEFPDVTEAHTKHDGLVAVGGDLQPQRLLAAYRRGIFPWYGDNLPIMWWSFPLRMVLLPKALKISRSLKKTLRNKVYEVTVNYAFDQVISACAKIERPGQNGRWLVPEMQAAYRKLYQQGNACSFECWYYDESGHKFLAGGLYGVVLGQIFYGESMFAHATDASKIAFVHAVHFLQQQGVPLIDCQVYSEHLASLGAGEIPHAEFMHYLQQYNSQLLPEPLHPKILASNATVSNTCNVS